MRRILILDDEENVALTLQDSLEKLPECEIAIATSSTRALQLLEQQPFDLLITDYKMPDMDGLALARHVRQLYPQTVIIIITAYSDQALRWQASRAYVHHVLDKPVGLAEIRSKALEALNGTKNRRAEVN